jgi:hypothetical protein
MIFVLGVWAFVRALLVSSAAVSLENVALRHQLAVLQRSVRRPRFRRRDRIFWLWLARLWAGWRASLVIVQPATVLAWHRQGFRLYWRWKSRRRLVGRPPLELELRTLIRHMARENPTWGRAGSKPNSTFSAMRSPSSPLPSTCSAPRRGHPRRGAPSWRRTSARLSLSTSSPYPRPTFASYSSWSSSPTTAGGLSTSRSPSPHRHLDRSALSGIPRTQTGLKVFEPDNGETDVGRWQRRRIISCPPARRPCAIHLETPVIHVDTHSQSRIRTTAHRRT